jgi:hypothetical protein
MSEATRVLDHGASERRIRFVEELESDDAVLMTFKDPEPGYAILAKEPTIAKREVVGGPRGDVLDVILLPLSTVPLGTQLGTNQGFAEWLEKAIDPAAPQPAYIKYRGVELMWRPGSAMLQCDPGQAESLLSAVVEFTHYESELRRIEGEIADSWAELEQDKGLAFEVTPAGLDRSDTVSARMNQVLQRRIRLARIEPHLYDPDASLPAAGQKLGEELREEARTEARLETVDAQLEVFEGIYEMSGQRMGEYRAAREEHVLEWIIIVLLAAEMLLLLGQMVWKPGA